MRLVYIDEAGISNPKHEPYMVVAGIIVDGDKQLNRLVERLHEVRKRLPQEHQDSYVFHAKEIFNGGGKVFKRPDPEEENPEWPAERRLEIADDIASIPSELGIPIVLGWVERAKWPMEITDWPEDASEKDKTMGCLATAFLSCVVDADLWMRKNASEENCLIYVEDNRQARSLITEVQNAHQDKRIIDLLDSKAKKFFPFKHIREDPAFQPKKAAHPLELSDFCAYVWKRFLMNQNDPFYRRFINSLRGQFVYFDPDSLPS